MKDRILILTLPKLEQHQNKVFKVNLVPSQNATASIEAGVIHNPTLHHNKAFKPGLFHSHLAHLRINSEAKGFPRSKLSNKTNLIRRRGHRDRKRKEDFYMRFLDIFKFGSP
ncbi:MAG: hypothetical protein V7K32_00705 [Nostoc sp.]